MYMNILQVGYTSKAHRFTSQIVSQMWSLVQSLTEMQIFLLTHPMGHFRVIFFRKNWDLSYRHIIYLGHPLKLKGVWENIILGDITGATPTTGHRHQQLFAPYRPSGRHGHRFWCKKSSCGVVKLLFKASVKKARNGPSTQLIKATSCVERSNATIK